MRYPLERERALVSCTLVMERTPTSTLMFSSCAPGTRNCHRRNAGIRANIARLYSMLNQHGTLNRFHSSSTSMYFPNHFHRCIDSTLRVRDSWIPVS